MNEEQLGGTLLRAQPSIGREFPFKKQLVGCSLDFSLSPYSESLSKGHDLMNHSPDAAVHSPLWNGDSSIPLPKQDHIQVLVLYSSGSHTPQHTHTHTHTYIAGKRMSQDVRYLVPRTGCRRVIRGCTLHRTITAFYKFKILPGEKQNAGSPFPPALID